LEKLVCIWKISSPFGKICRYREILGNGPNSARAARRAAFDVGFRAGARRASNRLDRVVEPSGRRRRRRERGRRIMRGDPKVIEYLNKALCHELTAVNQYWLHYRMLDNWGLKDLAKVWRKESIEEMQHADTLVARILFLEGPPSMQTLEQLRIGKNVQEILECDLAAEVDARALYLEAAQYCVSVNDRVSKALFEQLTGDEEHHIDFLETQLDLVKRVGAELYAQKHMGGLE
jgi:bacterioferritin